MLLSSPRRRGPIRRVRAMSHSWPTTDKSEVMGPRLRGDDSNKSRAHKPSRFGRALFANRHSLTYCSLLPKCLERQDRSCVLDPRDGLHLLIDEVPNVGI